MRWVTRERPKIDRIACPWLIARFIDEMPEFLYVPAGEVLRVAEETGAIPYDIPNVELSHVGELCSFDVRAIGSVLTFKHIGMLELTPPSYCTAAKISPQQTSAEV